ncbi:hypothetical protein [Kribbella sp. NPDC004875]|uniref:hypothetical protein n=1 Tax=Kribbella sp. NPDC004875 TaxID=3364107 RepID=UPI0036CB7B47
MRVTLTDAGRQAATAFHADLGAALGELTAPMPAADLELFQRAVEGILTRCRTSPSSE